MAMTIPMLCKSLEDLTGLVKESNKEKGDLAKIVKAKKAAIGFEDFLPEQPTPELKDITPDGLKNLTQTIEAKEDNNNSYSVILSNMGIFEHGKTYAVSADFKATTHIVPQYVTLECINSTKNEVIASNDTPVINGECSCSLSFEYNQTGDDEIHVLFYAGKKEATSGVACEYSNFKVEVLELFSQEEKKAAQQDLDVFLSKTEQYTNVIRNKNGGINVPDSVEETEAVNLKKVKEEIKNRIEELIDNAPDALNTLKELADALTENKDGITAINAALANRYTKQETNERIDSSIAAIPLAAQGDSSDENTKTGLGLTKTVNRVPNIQECQKNEPWSASPNWVFNLLMGTAQQDVNNQVSKALQNRVKSDNNMFCYRGSIPASEVDTTVNAGIYAVVFSSYTGCLLVFSPYGSTGIIQFYKAGYNGSTPWQYRNAIDYDTNRWTEWRTFLSQDNFTLTGTTLEITM